MHAIQERWIVFTNDGIEHLPVWANNKYHAMKIVEERNYFRVKAVNARRA